ncbi:MAG: aldo/keto reductase [Candidatus Aminicenantes bacterium]|nr:aldo/keto reductase [Candidatus Aminicenantes bacterium]
MIFHEPVILGRTGLKVGRLGIASGYGAPTAAIEEAFERGCNYFTWGTVIKGYNSEMRQALKNIVAKGQRDRLVLAAFTYAHSNFFTERMLRRGLKSAGLDHADVLILGYFSHSVPRRLVEGALRMKEKGLVRFIGLSSHNRKLLGELGRDGEFDVLHLRYNAAHRGAETEIFPLLSADKRPGTVVFTATRWGKLLNPKKMPPGEKPPTAADCYRFVLSYPAVDVCMSGPKTVEQMRENLGLLDGGPMSEDELARMRRIGDHVHGKPRR